MTIVSAFRASRGGDGAPGKLNHQTGCFTGAYTLFLANVVEININCDYDPVTCHWSPPPGLVEISGMIWWRDTFAPRSLTQPDAACIKVFKISRCKGPLELKAAPGWAGGGFPNTAGAALPPFIDLCEEGDRYGLFGYGTSASGAHDIIIDGHHAHSWWCGKAFGG